jgi:hypothetical protein
MRISERMIRSCYRFAERLLNISADRQTDRTTYLYVVRAFELHIL